MSADSAGVRIRKKGGDTEESKHRFFERIGYSNPIIIKNNTFFAWDFEVLFGGEALMAAESHDASVTTDTFRDDSEIVEWYDRCVEKAIESVRCPDRARKEGVRVVRVARVRSDDNERMVESPAEAGYYWGFYYSLESTFDFCPGTERPTVSVNFKLSNGDPQTDPPYEKVHYRLAHALCAMTHLERSGKLKAAGWSFGDAYNYRENLFADSGFFHRGKRISFYASVTHDEITKGCRVFVPFTKEDLYRVFDWLLAPFDKDAVSDSHLQLMKEIQDRRARESKK